MEKGYQENILKEYFFNLENNKGLEENKYQEALDILKNVENDKMWSIFNKHSYNIDNLQEYFANENNLKRNEIFKFGLGCFFRFIQCNFTGPDLPESLDTLIKKEDGFQHQVLKLLAVNNEDLNPNVKYPVLLLISKIVFEKCLVSNIVNSLWNWRYILIHQSVLDELSPLLLSSADQLYKQIETFHLTGYEEAKFNIEFAQLYLQFRNVTKAKEHISTADKILGIQYNLIGVLGKRTKHQENDIAQLTLKISLHDNENILRPPVHDFDLPLNVELKDDVRLNKIKFSDNLDLSPFDFPNTEQKLFLTRAQKMLIAKPQDDLQAEELEPFISLILSQKNTWAVRMATLLFRCKLEIKFRRTVERTMAQLEEIINAYQKPTPHPLSRIADVFGTGLSPLWKVQAQFADALLCMGFAKMAVEIYLKIHLYEEVIVCYTIMKLRHLAAKVIKEQLDKKPNPKLWCLLGDATDDISCYEKAWELSKKRSHRAQRHWGNFLFDRKQYQECIPHFEKSVSINPLQASVWSRLGFAALQVENWQVAATAYRRYTTLEPDGFEAWNNLAQAYIKIGNKRNAHQALLEALKFNFDNWKIWENLLVVSCDILHISNIIRAYHRLLDLKGKYLNIDVLHLLVYNVSSEIYDEEVKSQDSNLQKTRELLGRIVSIHPAEGFVWEMYADLVPPSILKVQRMQRAFRHYTSQPGWDKNSQTCVQVLILCMKLANLVLASDIEIQENVLNSVRMNLNQALAATKKHDWKDTKDLVEEVSEHLEKIIEKIKNVSVKCQNESVKK